MKVASVVVVFLVFVLLEIPDAESKKKSGRCSRGRRQLTKSTKQLKKCKKIISGLKNKIKKPPGSCKIAKNIFMNGALMSYKHTSEGCQVTECRAGKSHTRTICSPPKVEKVHWSYNDDGNNGPDNWKNLMGYSTCGYHTQSPIDITGAVTTSIPSFKFQDYDMTPSKVSISNNGHAAALVFEQSMTPELTGGGLPGTFKFHHIHFHWGSTSSQGSEHTVDGKKYPMEMHLVHYNAKYGDIGSAVASGNGDGLAVLGFLFKISDSDINSDYTAVQDGLDHIHVTGAAYDLPSLFSVDSLLSSNRDDFYRYHGSLTTPGCNQVVVWTVMKEEIIISEEQLDAFRKLEDDHSHHIEDNYRPVQPLWGRQIQSSN